MATSFTGGEHRSIKVRKKWHDYNYLVSIVHVMAAKTYAQGRKKMKHFHKWHWTPEEDALLTTFVERFGAGSWDAISRHIKGRTGKSCRLRWINQLNPNVNKSPFTEEEQRKLVELQKKYGNRWSVITKHFPGRTDNQLKNQYHVLMGNYHRSAGSSSSSHPQVPLEGGPIGDYYLGFTPYLIGMPAGVQAMPSFPGGVPSFYGMAETQFPTCVPYFNNLVGVKLGDFNYCIMESYGHPITSNANSVAFSGVYPSAQPQQGEGVSKPQFFDFMGVGTSE